MDINQYSELESLLLSKTYNSPTEFNEYGEMKNGVFDSTQLKSEKGATLFDFIKMIDKITSLTMKDIDVEFIPDEGKVIYLSNDQKLDKPLITYKLKERKPKGELKPRFRENFIENKDPELVRVGEIYGQKFKCLIQFDIFANTYELSEQILNRFEDMMLSYAGYFKRNGISEIVFQQQYTDDSIKSMRQTLSIRSICYYVEIEKITVIMRESIKDINII